MIEWQVNNATSFKKCCFSEANCYALEVKRIWQVFVFFFLITLFFTFRHLSHKEKCTKRDLL